MFLYQKPLLNYICVNLALKSLFSNVVFAYFSLLNNLSGLGIHSFAHRSLAHSLILLKSNEWLWAIPSDPDLSELLKSLRRNERPWANCSDRSEEMSDRERIAQAAQDKWATLSDWLRSLRGNERMSDSLKKFWQKKSKILFFNFFRKNYIQFFYWKNKWVPHFAQIKSLRSLTKNERCERLAQVAHQKWETMSDSLTSVIRSLTKNERSWVNCSGRSPKISKWVNRSIFLAKRAFAHFWAKTSD